ncbi:iron-containing alcohol dehydrogenase [Erysipelothrix inopinata]|uniref:Iron-containing alcohol dehydrogenase n=1 Tax=Erysipelothrix inopinata TaxID=225084 RepID=A0A7G9RW71_9FIRM|nr:iron-containing alcohol dehydrogenase [Erysipelothrix inopinata]QNN59846.1 iron-containing alcohol dehydrogenase [Erysipelothrix inopinata]
MTRYYQPTQIHFGPKKTECIGEITKKYGNKALLISSADEPLQPLYTRVKSKLDESGIVVTHFTGVVPNPTVDSVEEVLKLVEDTDIDVVVVVGGGSAIDTAKAFVFKSAHPELSWDTIFENFGSPVPEYEPLDNPFPIVAIPTTSGTGSHVTQAAVLSFGSDKLTLFHQDLFSQEAIIDPELTTTLPKRMTAATAFDTFTHAFESYVSPRANDFTRHDSIEAMKRVLNALPKVLDDPTSISLRTELSVADSLGGRALANAGASTPHPLSEIIGGITGAVHGEALACVYPAFIKYGMDMFPNQFEVIAQLFGSGKHAEDLEALVRDFLVEIGLTRSLDDFITQPNQREQITSHPALDHLPFGNKEYFVKILNES